MAQPLSTIGFNAGQSEKQSAENCINYIPFPTSANDLNGGQVSLYSTTGIEGPYPSFSGLVNDGFDFLYSTTYKYSGAAGGIGGQTWAYWNGFLMQYSSDQCVLKTTNITGTSKASLSARFAGNNDFLVFIGSIQSGATFCQKLDAGTAAVTDVDISTIRGIVPSPGQNEPVFLSDVAYLADRWLYLSSASAGSDQYGKVYFSDVSDPDIPSSSSFIGTTDDTGELRGLHVMNGRLYVFSEKSMYVFAPNNSNTIPYIEQQSSRVDVGLISASCKAEIGNTLYFIGRVGGRNQLMTLSGGSVSKISTPAIDYELNNNWNWTDIYNFAYLARVFDFSDAGRSYVAFTFNGKTFCYDPETKLFHTRSSELNPDGQQWDVAGSGDPSGPGSGAGDGSSMMVGMRIIREVDAQNRMLFNFGETNKDKGTEFGQLVERTAISAPYNSNGVTNNVREIQVISDIDNNPLDPNWPEPNINLSTSKEYSYSFSPEKSRQFGEQGVRDRLLRWRNLGIFRQAFVIKLRTKQPYTHQIVKVLAQIEKGFRQR